MGVVGAEAVVYADETAFGGVAPFVVFGGGSRGALPPPPKPKISPISEINAEIMESGLANDTPKSVTAIGGGS